MRSQVLLAVISVLLAAGGVLAADGPAVVSPGDPDRFSLLESRCPSFSWAVASGARSIELRVYRLGGAGEEPVPVLRLTLPGAASSWTPPLGSCLERGARYAWSVRSIGRKDAGEWSAPSFFQVAPAPVVEEVESALRVLQEFLAARNPQGDAETRAGEPVLPAESDSVAGALAPTSEAVEPAALTVDGGVVAGSFTGDGSTVTNLDPDNLAAAVPEDKGGTGAVDAAGARTNLGAAAAVDLANHVAAAGAHHPPYDDAAAVAAMGAKAASNPLHHDRPTEAEILAAVAASSLLPGDPCDGPGEAPQWTGTSWTCANVALPGSDGEALGFEIVDPWGEAWDGLPRGAATWAAAKADCEARGGRLPTVSELYRNNLSSGSGALFLGSDIFHWTLIQSADADIRRVTVRVSDGVITRNLESNSLGYRCVWPDAVHTAFSGDACHGPAGAECAPRGPWHNIDQYDRPPIDFAAAVNECNFYHGSVATLRDLEEGIHEGLGNGSNSPIWASDPMYWAVGIALAQWSGVGEEHWYYPAGPPYDQAPSARRFRCVGKAASGLGVGPGTPSCQGGCFSATGRRGSLVADSDDRASATLADAAADCRAAGGTLPYLDQFTDLVHAGWPNGSNSFLWTVGAIWLSSGAFGYDVLRFDGVEQEQWAPSASTAGLAGTGSVAYRCVWPERLETVPTVCAADESQNRNGSGFSCVPAVDGDSAGDANPGGVSIGDGWGNDWDSEDRTAATWADANQLCEALGASIPTASELYRVRFGNPFGVAIGDAGDTGYLWTRAPGAADNTRTGLRLSDGGTSTFSEAGTQPYRCVWRTSLGDVLGGRGCQGEPADPCFQSGDLRVDRYDRPQIQEPGASFECRAVGGRLPDLGELQDLIHSGAPNGVDQWLWLAEPVSWNGGYYAIARWVGTGASSWNYGSSVAAGNAGHGTYSYGFRCIFSNRLE